ncbi:phospholipase A2 inhibitor [Cimex lectularius]|uniref:Uncharacterized protein n=1 Tax=Cimex lectularius TaxID=79782 RepID=A0A8I6RKL8_CIMLE|nr:phospholipase A2 inhibitor [Cimex lectularius]
MRPFISLALFIASSCQFAGSTTYCDEPFEKCLCGEMEYVGRMQYVLNCTGHGFTNASILQHLPQKTQVLIFVGNNIPKLPRNLLGTTNNNSQLRVIDMSNNKIEDILGQTFHHVPRVERLILNHNEISISFDQHHPRVFSNFQSLLELHLTNAFADNTPDDLAIDLHDIFNTSGLTKLRKLHLEDNEIKKFKDPKIFCELNSLMDLHLGNNKLQHVNFKFDCLQHLRLIDLERNSISYFKPEELESFDQMAKKQDRFVLDFSDNPLICGQKTDDLYAWLQKTQAEVRNKERLRCKPSCPKEFEKTVLLSEHRKLSICPHLLKAEEGYSSSTVFLLSLALVLCLSLLIYTNRTPLKATLFPIIQNLSRKVHYTNIGKPEAQEMDV